VRVFYEALPVPNNTPHIQRVLQNAILAFPTASNGRGVPVTTARGANAIAIKGAGYVAWRFTVEIRFKYPPHDAGFVRQNLQSACLPWQRAVSVRPPAIVAPVTNNPGLSPLCLLR